MTGAITMFAVLFARYTASRQIARDTGTFEREIYGVQRIRNRLPWRQRAEAWERTLLSLLKTKHELTTCREKGARDAPDYRRSFPHSATAAPPPRPRLRLRRNRARYTCPCPPPRDRPSAHTQPITDRTVY